MTQRICDVGECLDVGSLLPHGLVEGATLQADSLGCRFQLPLMSRVTSVVSHQDFVSLSFPILE